MRRTRKTINQINVVPYIDVMLVLLVIFMVTRRSSTRVDRPAVGRKQADRPRGADAGDVAGQRDVDARGQAGRDAGIKVSLDELVARVKAKQAAFPISRSSSPRAATPAIARSSRRSISSS
jgi:biopolymer transport protein TolR